MTVWLTEIAQPPLEMTTPPGAHRIALLAIGAVVAMMLVAALLRWRRTGNPTGVLLMVGGLFCSLNEALVDVLGHCFFPKDGWIAYEIYGFAVPWWVVIAYVGFFGGLTWLTVELFQSGASRRTVWLGVVTMWVINVILEVPILASGLYVYYGDQPYEVFGFPLNWLVINDLGSLFAAVVVVRFSSWFTGAAATVAAGRAVRDLHVVVGPGHAALQRAERRRLRRGALAGVHGQPGARTARGGSPDPGRCPCATAGRPGADGGSPGSTGVTDLGSPRPRPSVPPRRTPAAARRRWRSRSGSGPRRPGPGTVPG